MFSRKLALQALYQWQLSNGEISEIEKQFQADKDFQKADAEYFKRLLTACTTDTYAECVAKAVTAIGYSMARVDFIECAILRIALYEMKQGEEVDYPIAINEAVRLAKKFGNNESYRFINKVLDQKD